MIRAIDLFCGAGGLTRGLEKAGLEVTHAVDLDPACKHPITANTSARFVLEDVADLKRSRLKRWFRGSGVTCIVGCAPCQPFSTYTQRKAAHHDRRWKLLDSFRACVEAVCPDIVSMENVPALQHTTVYRRFVSSLIDRGYFVSDVVVDAFDYGVPQHRLRLVLLASRLGDIRLVRPTHRGSRRRTVRGAISGLPRVVAGATATSDLLHSAASLSAQNIRRIRASKAGGTWRDWPRELRAKCHTHGNGPKYPSVYGRMSWDKPAPTITTQCFNYGSGRFGHPVQDRAITLREAALLQTFPRAFSFVPDGELPQFASLGRLIGNAVPVRLGEVVGRSIAEHVQMP